MGDCIIKNRKLNLDPGSPGILTIHCPSLVVRVTEDGISNKGKVDGS